VRNDDANAREIRPSRATLSHYVAQKRAGKYRKGSKRGLQRGLFTDATLATARGTDPAR